MGDVIHLNNLNHIVSKDDDELLKKWVMIGHHFFSDGYGDISIPIESCPIVCKLGDYNTLCLIQSPHDGLSDELNLSATIDRADALRLAGLLISWACDERIHKNDR